AGSASATEHAVSWSRQVFHHPASVARASVLADARALTGMMDFYRKVRAPEDPVVHAQYVVLASGLSAAYPGHGAYPPGFDARERPWFALQRQAPGFRWYRPHFDVATGALVFNATLPLFDADGAFLGITGIDVNLPATFSTLTLPAQLSEGSELMQVAALRPPLVETPRLIVLARQRQRLNDSDWRTLPEIETLDLGNATVNATLLDAMLERRNGHLRAQVAGADSFVLYQRFGEAENYVVMVVPVAQATRAAAAAGDYARVATGEHVTRLVIVLLLTSVVVIAVAVDASRHLTRPIEQLRSAVGRLAAGDFDARATVTTGDELQALGEAFDTMVPRLREHARVAKALGVAEEVQQQLLPPGPPTLAGFDIAGQSRYCDQTGGDYFDFIPVDEAGERLTVVIGDVAGHGIGPALLMATTRALLHGGRERAESLAELLGDANRHLADDVTRGHFVTLFVLGLSANEDRVSYAVAGHDPALWYHAAEGATSELSGEGIPLGIDPGWDYAAERTAMLRAGDLLVIGTDGVWETPGPGGERFGKARLRDYVVAHANESAADIAAGLHAELARFRGERPQQDDTTVVVVRRQAG
ncbi:MAG: SpoIIE family protein phosphatase, partial [Gammaproteobacteria bacterium]